MKPSTILVTGGAGYIGSHTCLELLHAGHDVVVVDNHANSSPLALQRVEALAEKNLASHRVDLRDYEALRQVFAQHAISAVIHFAGLKAVGESVREPLRYYQNNLIGTLNLLDCMQAFGVRNFVFSSSATVYGDPETLPLTEDCPLSATNPYGRSKLIIEDMLRDLHHADNAWNLAILRYFNPVGAHESGQIGEDPTGIPNNLMPYIAQVAAGKLQELSIFGNDYPTPDGTGVRDYIHVVDLALGHLQALQKLEQNPGAVVYNLGTGQGYSVLEMVQTFERATGITIPYRVTERRAGDVAIYCADPSLAQRELDWRATRGLEEMCADTWRWQHGNPDGYI